MAYIEISDVQAALQHVTISDTSDPNTTEVNIFITQVEASMDARFNGVGIIVPVTGTAKLNVVKPIAIDGVKARVLRSIDLESEAAIICQRLYEEAMKGIEKNPSILNETGITSSVPGGSDRGEIKFRKDVRQW